MTAERKEMETNVLASQLEKAYEGLKQGPSRTTIIYLGIGLAVVLIYLVWNYMWQASEEDASRRWLTFDRVVFPEQVDGLVKDRDLQNTTPARMARYLDARIKLREGLEKLGSDKSAALEQVKAGTEIYEALVKENSDPVKLLRQEALSGAARGNEALNNLDQARAHYETLAREFKDSALGKDADKQLDRLKNHKADLEALGEQYAPTKKE